MDTATPHSGPQRDRLGMGLSDRVGQERARLGSPYQGGRRERSFGAGDGRTVFGAVCLGLWRDEAWLGEKGHPPSQAGQGCRAAGPHLDSICLLVEQTLGCCMGREGGTLSGGPGPSAALTGPPTSAFSGEVEPQALRQLCLSPSLAQSNNGWQAGGPSHVGTLAPALAPPTSFPKPQGSTGH